MEKESFDLAIIGAGPGGYEAAFAAAGYGLRTVLIERKALGGTCLNCGCIPTKTLLHAAGVLHSVREAGTFGVTAGELRLDMPQLQSYKREVVAKLQAGIAQRLRQQKITVVEGDACVEAAGRIRISDGGVDEITAKNILIAAGAVPAVPPIPGAGLPGVLVSDGLLELEEVPKRLVIIGGGVIGVEFAALYVSLGTQVTLLEALDRILLNLDKELSQSVKLLLKKQGVNIHTSACVDSIEASGTGLRCAYTEKNTACSAEADKLLIAAGRRAAGDGIVNEALGLAMDQGRILVDETYKTNVPGIYAIGDVTGAVQLAHAAMAQGRNAAAIIAGHVPGMRTDLVPACIYTEPEAASVGLTVDDAKKSGRKIITRKYSMGANGRTVLSGAERGYIRIVADENTHVLLGAQLFCERASDIVSELSLAIAARMRLEEAGSVIHPHPSFGEAVGEVLREI